MSNFDPDKLLQKISTIEDCVAKLEVLANLTEASFLVDFRNSSSAKYLLQIAIEAMIDISNHIIARERLGKPETHKQAFEKLAVAGFIQPENVPTYFLMSKFRNKVVHMYHEINDRMIFNILQANIADFQKFIAEINTAITQN